MAAPRIAYCTNVSAAPSLAALEARLSGIWTDVRHRTGLERLGLGLWFPRDVAAELAADDAALDRLRSSLAAARLEALTYNAFPADDFHAPVVKQDVYAPNWLTAERRTYTLHMARIAAALAKPGDVIPISTLPLGFPKWDERRRRIAADQLAEVAMNLAVLEKVTGVSVRLAIEPEPACVIETTDEMIAFWNEILLPMAAMRVEHVQKHLGVCLDLCHAAVEHEDPIEALARYADADIPVHKVQVSAAVEVPRPDDPEQRRRLSAFAEERWLHQVGAPDHPTALDLPNALADEALAAAAPWRVHFHMPLHESEVGGLPTTRPIVQRFLHHVATLDAPPLLELETYTWSVVPDAPLDLPANLAAEIAWVRQQIEPAR